MTSKQNYDGTIIRFSLHEICSPHEFSFIPEEYSKFKHGAENIAQQYGYALADSFTTHCFSHHYRGEPIVVLSSAYSHIPTASFYMKNYFVDKLNGYLFDKGYPVVEEAKIYRTVSYREDYGEMSAEQRYNLIRGDTFYIDKEFLKGKQLVFLDDIKITGTHEWIILNMLNQYDLSNTCYMLYFAELIDKSIPPNIENRLNYAYVKSLDEIDTLIKNEQFHFNTRVVKLILNSQDHLFDRFIEKQDIQFIRNLYYKSIGNDYFKFSKYLRNLNQLTNLCNTNTTTPA
ncbi:MAG: phosphoribosyltransferase family protein [Tannerellaceae bacterium]|jgi:hypothetical protein|nr:phosphoribosyltransferase family protein [Tannerellaceae bacterium]